MVKKKKNKSVRRAGSVYCLQEAQGCQHVQARPAEQQ
eukprot:CAMPEP_0174372396 /NCGR_PEP_ID=MMETSP0811_2-20130205/103454_1 /TAXON_ID=73025 ORGANISM="Eutreptiella gymnastica-like, Strain CCMP1594" /NCGR_SAMPLE_ID=MMETSP0811_2 /ASSEMBLY_ACC=CAM_ASM_000667 /LENGTH=36 /DNA_ID= /DNA_START= /DNA_END= /DNA_ORIENTATION=